ncbi:hypothetical protein E2542_SST02902 [Spatholobus suberectus]|nr:hypothetical protein E2542_SST02902 [Spatholobus suberectus]
MASLPQMCAPLGACMSCNKIIDTRPCIAQLCNYKKSTHFSKLVANHQIAKGTLFPLALVGQKKQCQNEKWKARAGETPESLQHSLIETAVEDFYRAFNDKKIDQLKQLVSDDCEYQDLLFYSPRKGQDVLKFWQHVMDAMGPHVEIVVESIEVDNLVANVSWHLKWDERKIPFTYGYRIFKFKEHEGRFLIGKIYGLEELPLKPDELVLNVLKAIRTFLDSYPTMGRGLLDALASQDGRIHGGSP